MNPALTSPALIRLTLLLATTSSVAAQDSTHDQPRPARLEIRTAERAANPIPPFLTGKFAEHLGNNIYNGMDAQILRNPTFAAFPFSSGRMSPDGIALFHHEADRIARLLRERAQRQGFPNSELASVEASYTDGLAALWQRVGPREEVGVSPDTGPFGGRAQRVEVRRSGQGIAQWTWLPLQRVREFEVELFLRSTGPGGFRVGLDSGDAEASLAQLAFPAGDGAWVVHRGRLRLPADASADAAYRLALVADAAGSFVLGRIRLWPADHVNGCDPDVIRLLRESHLPLLRWPGGNFVSGYHWEDGVGPVERRPTRPNYAWGGLEPNLFGTDEFIAFCRAVGCEPMICVNAGDGTPEEAARWIEYCNGPRDSVMGRRRAENGHPEPFNVRHWEVGNELWGRWQYHWTTATGNVDRYRRFAQAMLAEDPTVRLYACGAPVFWGKAWNDTLMAALGPEITSITDHPLIGGDVRLTADPLDVFRDFMAVPHVLENKWGALRDDLARAGVREPRLAVTELQVFAHLGPRGDTNLPVKLTRENLPAQGSITEALYDILVYHAAVRLQPFVEMVTHSATVNHGGGLRKERERVYPNPCHHAQAAFASLAGATPVAITLEAPGEAAPLVLPELRNVTRVAMAKAVDALAAVSPDGDLLVSLVQGAMTPVTLQVELRDFEATGPARLHTLSAARPWEGNTLENPDAVAPVATEMALQGARLELVLKPCSVTLIRVPGRRN